MSATMILHISIAVVTMASLLTSVVAIDIPCKPIKQQRDRCSIRNLSGDYTNQTVNIKIQHPKKTLNVTIEEVKLGQLPPNFFKTFKMLQYLTINKCGLTTLEGFRGSKTLQQLHLVGNKIQEIGAGQLSPSIVYLEARNNQIQRIHKNAFVKLEYLYWLDLSYNRLRKIKRKMIVPSVTSLNLGSNLLRKIEGVFNNHSQIKYLDLDKNRIGKTITNRTFAGMTNLRELDLSNNFIETIECGAFRDSEYLRLLKLNKNRMVRLSLEVTSSALSLVKVHENNLKMMCMTSDRPPKSLADLKVVAHTNKLHDVRFSDGLPITSLSLDHNEINTVAFLENLPKLEQLSLSYNNLYKANFTLLQNTSINRLDLENTNLTQPRFKDVLALRHLILMLNVSKNRQLAGFNFSKTSCPVGSLYLNDCGFEDIDITDIKKTFRNLRELHVSNNVFNCTQLSEQQEQIRLSKIIVKCGDLIFK